MQVENWFLPFAALGLQLHKYKVFSSYFNFIIYIQHVGLVRVWSEAMGDVLMI